MGLRGPFQPDQLVDVTGVWEKNLASVHAHESQPLPFYLTMIERQRLAHGRVAGARFAEAFLDSRCSACRRKVCGWGNKANQVFKREKR